MSRTELAPQSHVAFEIDHLAKDYGGPPVLVDVHLRVPPGCIFGYLGANGAGKTTTLKIAAGLLRPTRGDVRIAGHSILTSPLEAKARLGYLPESGAVFEKLTPREYLEFAGTLYDLAPDLLVERIEQRIAFFGLHDFADRRMNTLSKGQKQRVCWASALIHDPAVMLLDEPLAGLDVGSVSLVKELMRRLAQTGHTIVYSSHLVDVVEKLCDRLALIHGGRIVATGTVDEIVVGTGSESLEHAVAKLCGAPLATSRSEPAPLPAPGQAGPPAPAGPSPHPT